MTTASQMYVDIRTSVTTCGPHNGIVIHSGIQQGKHPASVIWPYSENLRSVASVQLPVTPTPVQESIQWHKEPSPPPSPVYTFENPDSPPDEFIGPDKLQLNIFKVDPADYADTEFRKTESRKESVAKRIPNAVLEDTVTTTTTVEVFRTNVDPNKPNEYLELPPVPAPGLDKQPHLLRADGPGYEKWTTTASETRQDKQREWRIENSDGLDHPQVHFSGIAEERPSSSLKGTIMPYTVGSYQSPSLLKEVREIRQPQVSSTNLGAQKPMRPDGEELLKQDRHGSQNEKIRIDGMRREMTPQRTDSRRTTWMRRNQQNGIISREAPSEEIFHLYETRDAFGNVRAKCELGINLSNDAIAVPRSPERLDESLISESPVEIDRSKSVVSQESLLREEHVIPDAECLPVNRNLVYNNEIPDHVRPTSFNEILMHEKPPTLTAVDENLVEHERSGECDMSPNLSPLPDLTASPSKSILHVVRRPVRRGRHPRKSVRFPAHESNVTVNEHRLIITDINDSDDHDGD